MKRLTLRNSDFGREGERDRGRCKGRKKIQTEMIQRWNIHVRERIKNQPLFLVPYKIPLNSLVNKVSRGVSTSPPREASGK